MNRWNLVSFFFFFNEKYTIALNKFCTTYTSFKKVNLFGLKYHLDCMRGLNQSRTDSIFQLTREVNIMSI